MLNESDADFHFKTTGKANFRRLMNSIYPLLRIRYFLARGGIEPPGRCFYATTPAGLLLIIPLIDQSLPPLIYNRLLRNFLCPNCRATSLMPVCIAGPTSDQTATNRHESPLQFSDRCDIRARNIFRKML